MKRIYLATNLSTSFRDTKSKLKIRRHKNSRLQRAHEMWCFDIYIYIYLFIYFPNVTLIGWDVITLLNKVKVFLHHWVHTIT